MAERILVTGATGKTGTALIRHLRVLGAEAVAATRRPTEPGQVGFDWREPASHETALDGVTAVYLVAPSGTTDALGEMRPFLRRAVESGVGRLVLLSASSLPPGGPMMGAVHAWLAEHAPWWAVLRPSWFMQNFVTQHLPGIRQASAVVSAAGDGRIAFIDVDDIAAVAARALADPLFENRQAPVLTGPEALSYDDAARAISIVCGREIGHVRLTVADLRHRYQGFGLPADYAAMLAGMDGAIAEGAEDRVTREVARLAGRPPKRLAAMLAENRSLLTGD